MLVEKDRILSPSYWTGLKHRTWLTVRVVTRRARCTPSDTPGLAPPSPLPPAHPRAPTSVRFVKGPTLPLGLHQRTAGHDDEVVEIVECAAGWAPCGS